MELAYRIEERAPTATRLEEDDDGGCVVTFKLMPRWVTVFPVPFAFVMAGVHLIGAAYAIWVFASSPFLGTGSALGHSIVYGVFLIPGLVWVGFALFFLRTYRLYGRVPRSLAIHVGTGRLSSRAEAGARWWSWPLDAVKSVRVSPVKSILRGKDGAAVVVSIRGRMFPLRFTFGARDVGLAERFAEKLRGAVAARSVKNQE